MGAGATAAVGESTASPGQGSYDRRRQLLRNRYGGDWQRLERNTQQRRDIDYEAVAPDAADAALREGEAAKLRRARGGSYRGALGPSVLDEAVW